MSRSARRGSTSPTAAMPLWVANAAGRGNLRNGIAPPDSSHPKFHNCAGAIDYQIEADYSGLIAPGMPNVAIALGEKFGRLMNYGDGVYAGQFMGAMYAEAFFEKDVDEAHRGRPEVPFPRECQYAEMVRDMLQWHKENPTDWEKTWALAEKKYNQDKNYNISALDVKRKGACVLMGLLYGKGDLDQTIIISCRCGFDSDCNPSSSGGVLFTTLRLLEAARPVLPQARRDEDLQPHGLQLPGAARRLREAGPPGAGAGRRPDREGRQRRGSLRDPCQSADAQQVRGPEEPRPRSPAASTATRRWRKSPARACGGPPRAFWTAGRFPTATSAKARCSGKRRAARTSSCSTV